MVCCMFFVLRPKQGQFLTNGEYSDTCESHDREKTTKQKAIKSETKNLVVYLFLLTLQLPRSDC